MLFIDQLAIASRTKAPSTNQLDEAVNRIVRPEDRVRDARSAAPQLAAVPTLTMRLSATECVASLAMVRRRSLGSAR
jgi:hypothetical protein